MKCFGFGFQIKALHQYDCLRANKATSAWGIEARVPFLDKEFINCAMAIDPEWKMVKPDQGRIEKWVLRKAFDDEDHPYLPKVGIIILRSEISYMIYLTFIHLL